jgi:predicted metal-dependent phosphoesterase TrpH
VAGISIQNEMKVDPPSQFPFSALKNSVQSIDLKSMRHAFDLHLHTHYSADACGSPEAMVAAAKHKGLSGIAVTDHNTCDAVDYLTRKGLIRADGLPVDGFLIVPGVEVSTADGHLICLGTTLPFMKGRPAAEVVGAILDRGGIAVAPHPFDRFRAGIRQEVLDDLELAALETFNAAVTFKSFNAKAAAYARRRGLAATAGSDAHHASAAGISSTAYELTELSLTDLLLAIPKGGALNANYLPFREAMKKNFGNWFRIFNPKPEAVLTK